MIKALKQIDKETYLEMRRVNTRKQSLSRLFFFLFFIACISACSTNSTKPQETEWEYPHDNPFPSVMTKVTYESELVALKVELKPETIDLSCRLRNDSPYYWCDFEGDLKNPSPKLPHKISTTFHTVVHATQIHNAIDLKNRLKEKNIPVFAILTNRPFISSESNSIYSQLLSLYNAKECSDLFHDYSLCPKKAKKLNIFTGKYIDE